MKLTIDIPDGVAQRLIDAVASNQGWTEASGQSKAQFAKRYVIETLRANVRQHEGARAGEQARRDAEDRADTEITLS